MKITHDDKIRRIVHTVGDLAIWSVEVDGGHMQHLAYEVRFGANDRLAPIHEKGGTLSPVFDKEDKKVSGHGRFSRLSSAIDYAQTLDKG